MVNEIRAGMGLPSLDPPDTDTDTDAGQ